MHHKLAFPVLVALCISSFGLADAKNGPNWSRSNRVQPPAAKRQDNSNLLAIVPPLGFNDPAVLSNGPTSTTSTTSATSTSASTTSTSSDTSVTSTSDSSTSGSSTSDSSTSQTSATDTATSTTPTTTADPTTPTTPVTTPTTTTTPGDPLSSILSGILNPTTSTGSDTLTLIGSPTETPTNTPTPTDTPTATPTPTDPPNTDTATTTPIDISSVLSSILSSLTDTSSPTNTIIGSEGPTSTDTSVPTSTDTGIPPTSTDTAGPTGPTGPTTTDTGPTTTPTSTVSPTSTTTPFDPNNTSLFPTTTTSLDPGDATTITTQPPTTLSTPTDYGYLSVTTLALTSIPTTTPTPTQTDPDAPTTTTAPIDPTANPNSVPVFPADLPMKIVPADGIAAGMTQDQLAGYTPITILFDVSKMPWKSVLDSSELLGQILAFFSQNVAHALGLDPSQVITTSLAAYAKAGWSKDEPNALMQLATTWNGLIPNGGYLDDLSAQIRNPNSPFYTSTAGIPNTLASLVVPTFNIASSNGSSNGGVAVGANAAGTSAPTDTSKNTIIGVTTTVGVILVLLIAFFLVKMYKRSRESAHRRLSGEPMTGPAMRSYGSQGFTGGAGAGGSMGRGNRDSFFFAEDSLRGYQHDGTGSVEDDDSYTSHQPNQARRAPIQASAISQPILRESSMGNW